MRALILIATCAAISAAVPEEVNSKQKRGLLELEHAPVLAKGYETPILHAAPVVTKVFEAPPAPYYKGLAEPLIAGPLITKGFGPHIYGAKTIYPAPIIKAAPIYTAPIYSKPILTHAPILSYGAKLAPISYGHGW